MTTGATVSERAVIKLYEKIAERMAKSDIYVSNYESALSAIKDVRRLIDETFLRPHGKIFDLLVEMYPVDKFEIKGFSGSVVYQKIVGEPQISISLEIGIIPPPTLFDKIDIANPGPIAGPRLR